MIGGIHSVVLDCPDPLALAEFYSALTGLPRTQDDAGWVVLGGDDGWRLSFQKADEYTPSTWPDPAVPPQFHLDVHVDDVDAAEARVLDLGAKRLPGQGKDFRVYADPAGHPFCLVYDVA
jgi:catechol 2,3-dioxygenase-like lactoylglutathione lyase family enzyme